MKSFDITWILAAISISGNAFNVKKKVICFYIWSFAEILWLILDVCNGVYGRAFLDLVQLGFAVWGIYEWQFKNKNKVGGSS